MVGNWTFYWCSLFDPADILDIVDMEEKKPKAKVSHFIILHLFHIIVTYKGWKIHQLPKQSTCCKQNLLKWFL